MSAAHYETIDSVLLLLSEARERAEGAAKALADEGGQAHLVEALHATDRELLALHRRLMDGAYFSSGQPRPKQLELDAA
ncbi:MAG: hypothetical protein H0V45_03740 [Actinobacteria bacterium]|nr:hypothetical protein [Actinomycetota bacterium]